MPPASRRTWSASRRITGWGEALCQGLQAPEIAAAANHSLFAREPMLEFDTSSHPFREHLTDAPLRHKDGRVDIPRRPGLGIEISRDAIEKYAVA